MNDITKGLGTDLDSWNAMKGPGDLSNVNDSGANKKLSGISDKIDISNEHLEMLRDNAEEKKYTKFCTIKSIYNIRRYSCKKKKQI